MKELLFKLGLLNPLGGLLEMFIILHVAGLIIILGCKWINGKEPFRFDGFLSIQEKRFIKSFFLKYTLWGFVQQLVVVILFNLQIWLFGYSQYLIITTASLFALMHFPNFLLFFATGFMGCIFMIHFNIHHNLYVIGIVHGMIATILQRYLPDKILTTFTIWKSYAKRQRKVS